MAFTHPNQQDSLKKQDSQVSRESRQTPPEDHQSAATGYPLPMDYQPGYSSGQSGYPINIYNRTYSVQPYPYPPPPPRQFIPPPSQLMLSDFTRGIIGGLVFFFILSGIIGLTTYLLTRPHLPEFHIVHFSVTNFNTPAAVWLANVTVRNPNTKTDIFFDQIEINIFHVKNRIVTSGLAPFLVEKKKLRSVEMKLPAANGNDPASKNGQAAAKMEEEKRKTGQVSVSLQMMLLGNFKSSKSSKSMWLKVSCEDLSIGLKPNTTISPANGKLNVNPANPNRHCKVANS